MTQNSNPNKYLAKISNGFLGHRKQASSEEKRRTDAKHAMGSTLIGAAVGHSAGIFKGGFHNYDKHPVMKYLKERTRESQAREFDAHLKRLEAVDYDPTRIHGLQPAELKERQIQKKLFEQKMKFESRAKDRYALTGLAVGAAAGYGYHQLRNALEKHKKSD